MRRPVIGIPAKEREKSQNDYWHRMEVVDDLRYLTVKYGGTAVMLLPGEVRTDFNKSDLSDPAVLSEEEKEILYQEVSLCDGILLQGGDYSNAYEVEIARYALEKDLPVLGICAGFNNILRALASTPMILIPMLMTPMRSAPMTIPNTLPSPPYAEAPPMKQAAMASIS